MAVTVTRAFSTSCSLRKFGLICEKKGINKERRHDIILQKQTEKEMNAYAENL